MIAQLGRFTVRDLTPWDAERLFVLTGNPRVTQYMGFRTHRNAEDTAGLIEAYNKDPTRKYLAVCPNNDVTDILGIAGFEIQRHQATMAIMFRPDWKARGAGREFSKPFVQWIFTHPQIWRVWAYCHVDNTEAQRVLERMGATCEGLLHRFEFFPNVSTEPQDCYVYAIVRE